MKEINRKLSNINNKKALLLINKGIIINKQLTLTVHVKINRKLFNKVRT